MSKVVPLADIQTIRLVFGQLSGATQVDLEPMELARPDRYDPSSTLQRRCMRWLSRVSDPEKGLEDDSTLFTELEACGVLHALPEPFQRRAAVLFDGTYTVVGNEAEQWEDWSEEKDHENGLFDYWGRYDD